MDNPSYYAIIPAQIRYDADLKPNEKLLYGEITALSNKYGYCNAGNAYFAELYKVEKKTISSWVNRLKDKGYIDTVIVYEDKKVVERRIYVETKRTTAKVGIPIHQKVEGYPSESGDPIHKKMEYNNTSINNKEEEKESSAVDFYNNNIGMITPFIFEDMNSYLNERNRREFDNRSNEKSSK